MSNTTAGILIATGVAGGALYYAKKRRDKSLLARTRRQAGKIADRASKLSDSAATLLDKSREEMDRQKKGVVEAIGAGKAAYLRVAG